MNRKGFRSKAKELGFTDEEVDVMIEQSEILATDYNDHQPLKKSSIEPLVEFGLKNLIDAWVQYPEQVQYTKNTIKDKFNK